MECVQTDDMEKGLGGIRFSEKKAWMTLRYGKGEGTTCAWL